MFKTFAPKILFLDLFLDSSLYLTYSFAFFTTRLSVKTVVLFSIFNSAHPAVSIPLTSRQSQWVYVISQNPRDPSISPLDDPRGHCPSYLSLVTHRNVLIKYQLRVRVSAGIGLRNFFSLWCWPEYKMLNT